MSRADEVRAQALEVAGAEPGGSQPRFDDGFFAAFRAFCAARAEDIIEVCDGRRYQMNEVARCAQAILGIAAVSGSRAAPVALVDLGTGAGLGLQLDRYRYRVGARTRGPVEAGLSLDCDVRGPINPPALIRDYQHDGVFAVLGARVFDEAGDRGRLLARAHPSGGWVQWLSGDPAPEDQVTRTTEPDGG